MTVQRIGFAYNPTIEATVELAARASGWCRRRGIDEWRALLPEIDVRFLLTSNPADSRLASAVEPQTLHDPQGDVRASIEEWPTPTAVLFGADGMLAGGPEVGADGVRAFVLDIRASLDEILAEQADAQAGAEVSPG